jgi:hypothetical protein
MTPDPYTQLAHLEAPDNVRKVLDFLGRHLK